MGNYLRVGRLFEGGAYLILLCLGWALIRGGPLTEALRYVKTFTCKPLIFENLVYAKSKGKEIRTVKVRKN